MLNYFKECPEYLLSQDRVIPCNAHVCHRQLFHINFDKFGMLMMLLLGVVCLGLGTSGLSCHHSVFIFAFLLILLRLG